LSIQQLVAPLDPSDEPLLTVALSRNGPDIVITISGELDMGTVHSVTELVGHVASNRPDVVVLDLANVSFFCADGLRSLIQARTMITAAGGRLVLRDPSAPTRRVLAITGTDRLFLPVPVAPR